MGWVPPDPTLPSQPAEKYAGEDFSESTWWSQDWGESYQSEDGIWYSEIPVWFQDWYSGAYWSEDTGEFECDPEEWKGWGQWDNSPPEATKEILSTWPEDENSLLNLEEEEPEKRSGSYWLPIFFGRKGKGPRRGGGKGKGGKGKGGRGRW